MQEDYFIKWGFQLPLVLYETVILQVFNTTLSLYLLNALYSIISCFLLYKILKKVSTNERIICLVMSLYLFMPSSIFHIGLLYNHVISGMFILLAVYFFCRKLSLPQSKIKMITCLEGLGVGLFLGMAKLFRSEAFIVLIAIGCFTVYAFISSSQENNKKSSLLDFTIMGILILTSYVVVFKVTDLMVQNMLGMKITNQCLWWKLVCGMTPQNYGRYDLTYSWIISVPKKEQWKETKHILSDIFSSRSLGQTLLFFHNKLYLLHI